MVNQAVDLATKRGVQMQTVYEAADSAGKDSVNILDLKLAFEKLVLMNDSEHLLMIKFIKEVKNNFKTANFSKISFMNYLKATQKIKTGL